MPWLFLGLVVVRLYICVEIIYVLIWSYAMLLYFET